MTQILSKAQAQHIAAALTTLNNVSIPYFRTAFTDKRGGEARLTIFEWVEAREQAGAAQVAIFQSSCGDHEINRLARRGFRIEDLDIDQLETHTDQNAFLEAYEV